MLLTFVIFFLLAEHYAAQRKIHGGHIGDEYTSFLCRISVHALKKDLVIFVTIIT